MLVRAGIVAKNQGGQTPPDSRCPKLSACLRTAHLVAEQGVDVGPVVDVPGLDRAVQGAAEQLVRASTKGQTRHGIPVPREALQAVKGTDEAS